MHTLRIPILFVAALAILFLMSFTDRASAATVCFDCHKKELFQDNIIHKPVAEAKCDVCHNPHVARYQGLLRDREDTLCYSCHKDKKKEFSQEIVHKPVTDGKCSACHAPHASGEKGLVDADLATKCLACHTDLNKEYKVSHKPFADGSCGNCHKPHQADNFQLLKDTPDALCISCHSNDSLQSSHEDYPLTLGSCLSCHNPHGSERAGLLRNFLHQPYVEGCSSCHKNNEPVTMSTCLSCHEKTAAQLQNNHSHITLRQGNSCLSCHSPHAGDDKALLKDREELICASCHQQTLKRYASKTSLHPPVKNCSTCHEPHGSINIAMLKGDGNAVCVQCHETQGNFTHPVGPGVLESRTGQMVTCVSCHNPMGADYKYHLIKEAKRALCLLCHRTY